MPPEDIAQIERLISAIQAEMNVSKWDAMNQAFLWGFEVAIDRLGKFKERGETKRVLVAKRLADALDRERRHDKRIFSAVKALGYDESLKIAEREGIELGMAREIIERATPRDDDMTASERMSLWLETVLGDGVPHSIDEIRDKGVEDEILPGEDGEELRKAWSVLKSVASRAGYSKGGERGMWQKQGRSRMLDD